MGAVPDAGGRAAQGTAATGAARPICRLWGRSVRLDLEVRRLRCANAACPRRTFAERVPSLVIPRARRTRRLAEAQSRIGFATSAAAGARLARALAMPASASTVLRLMQAAPVPRAGTPRAVGIDDWAWRKGRSYGTLVVDLERRRPLDLLPDRSGSTLAAWLRRRPEITVVARDRSTECARAVTAAAPGALQVADRWHLLLNARQAMERWLARSHGRLRRLPALEGDRQPSRRLRAFSRTDPEIAAGVEGRARWRAAYEEARRRHLAGEALMAIGQATGLARGTVRKYAHAEAFPERAASGPGPSLLDPYVPHLERRMAGGCEDALARFARGPRAGLRRHAPPSAAPCGRAALETGPPETGPPYGAQVAWPGRRPGRDGHGARAAVFQGACLDARAARGDAARARGRRGRPRPARRRGCAGRQPRVPVHRARAPLRRPVGRAASRPLAARSAPGSRMPGRAAPR